MSNNKGFFTLPGEAGFENLTLELAKKWGADVIRDSDGTKLSDEILNSGYQIYSTICLIRSDNEWAKKHRNWLQQNYLMSSPKIAYASTLEIDPLDGYYREQFMMNEEGRDEFWQVYDRTTGTLLNLADWDYNVETKKVVIHNATPWHKYTVNFLAVRLWEEISMYNHITNEWGDKEHLMAIEPRYPEVRAHIIEWLDDWCKKHPATSVVRFTSMFYNFAWFWGDDVRNRNLYSDLGSYDFTVNPIALREFKAQYGYKMNAEDFINAGKYNSTHNVPSKKYRDWIEFTHKFVVDFGKECIDVVHKYKKQAYVFYDDSWIGVEPYGDRFKEFGFDGIIKCVFNGFEVRLCADVKGVQTHEIRLHPYLFPTGLSGEATFAPEGNPKQDASRYWVNVRRALLRKPVDRIGLGGYLHLVEPFPDFCDYMEEIADEFRFIKELHKNDLPYTIPGKVVILTVWGKLRSWICSGHLHEHPEIDLTNVLEALAGLPVDVEFISFDELIQNGIPKDTMVIINAGCADSAWSGGDYWKDEEIISILTEWVSQGGGLIGIHEPTAVNFSDSYSSYFKLSHLFGVDRDLGDRKCIGKYQYKLGDSHFIMKDTLNLDVMMKKLEGIYITDSNVTVLLESEGTPLLTSNEIGNGRAIYLSSFSYSPEMTRLLLRAICYAGKKEQAMNTYICDNVYTDCAYYPENHKLVLINNAGFRNAAKVATPDGLTITIELKPYELVTRNLLDK
ncbi:MAG: D-galactosyl-beta-_4-L-rhamnose phosphorylase [Anaerocolumna sp.]|nr:D-galactosyl-beta->4-L-rhamnose phosphorylase [Anaerocolumna sp.]